MNKNIKVSQVFQVWSWKYPSSDATSSPALARKGEVRNQEKKYIFQQLQNLNLLAKKLATNKSKLLKACDDRKSK